MFDQENVSKEKIPRGFSYILKTKQFEELLTDNGIEIDAQLVFGFFKGSGLDMRAFYWIPRDNIPYERLYIQAGVVPSEQASFAKEKLGEVVFPEFLAWIKSILSTPEESTLRMNNLCFEAFFKDGDILIRRE